MPNLVDLRFLWWHNMDLLKLIALGLSPIIAVYAILVSYKKKTRDGDPKTEREVLTRAGWIALILVILAGLISVFSEVTNQLKKQAAQDAETRMVARQLNRLEKKQDDLNLISDRLSHRVEESLLLLRRSQGNCAVHTP